MTYITTLPAADVECLLSGATPEPKVKVSRKGIYAPHGNILKPEPKPIEFKFEVDRSRPVGSRLALYSEYDPHQFTLVVQSRMNG